MNLAKKSELSRLGENQGLNIGLEIGRAHV